ncbi:hypothetical protein DOTSEDRAFT_72336 [Dothistroma septosporum NZE10]|uniref:CENP-V/GFA domain-containing protein n=1 Tax=Dothistroma septosporum (strain NZE10 / CBS 128990) TaxID=675120 RepID=M2XK47_DOTSN|nr:hypothetical protein DOTSEDRAFT_72336 [Dothistroma septosporum NZE10]
MSADTPTTVTGSCLCQAVQYTLHGIRLTCAICGCNGCRRTSGSVCSLIQHYRDAALTLTSGEDVIKKYEDSDTLSGNVTERWFCIHCGSQMYGRSPTFKLYTLRVGCMNECPEKTVKPMGANFPERLPAWIERLPSMMSYPNVVDYFMSFMKEA